MINRLKLKIVNVYSSHKKLFIILGIFTLLLVLGLINFYLSKSKNTPPDDNNDTQNTANDQLPTNTEPQTINTFNENESYFINQIVTNLTPVTGFSWNGNKLIYSTPDGIYEAGTNAVVTGGFIEIIKWTDNFNAVVKIDGRWNVLDYPNKKLNELSYTLNNPKINSKGTRILDFQKNTVTLYNLTDNTSTTAKFEESVKNVFFVSGTDEVIVSTSFGNTSSVNKLDSNLRVEKSLNFDSNYDLSSISLNGENFALTTKNVVVTADFSNILATNTFAANSTLSTVFSTNSSVVVVEKYKDSLGRTLDNIYLLGLDGNKTAISDSKPIPQRINFKVPFSLSAMGSVVAFAENNGKVWILALKVNLFPTYSTDGTLVFSNIKPTSH